MFLYDLKIGIGKHRFYLISIPIFLVITFLFAKMGRSLLQLQMVEEQVTFGDAVLYCMQGIEPLNLYEKKQDFRFPIYWMAVFLGSSFSTIGFAEKQDGYSQQVLLRCKKRSRWWLSKCLWNIATTTLYFSLGAACIFVVGMIEKWNWTLQGSRGMTIQLFGMVLKELDNPPVVSALQFLVTAIFSNICWNIFQMYISLYLKSFVSFIITISMIISSIYICSPFLLGNYMMAMRYEHLLVNGMQMEYGILLALVFGIWGTLGGLWKTKHLDYFAKED